MNYNELYYKALLIAKRAHAGQKDKAGQDYITHPIRVAERCDDPRAKIVALLHDTIEDSDVTADYLRKEGFREEIVEAVLAVTRREGEDYDDYVRRAAQNELIRMVKRADLEDNMDIRRLPELTDRDVERLRKYLRAWQYLSSEK
ncbi:MAG: hypothetical protein IKH97_01900 [Bacteroidales bacterium]|nr:hypothetical protein [Bacteroidales bacterium]